MVIRAASTGLDSDSAETPLTASTKISIAQETVARSGRGGKIV